MKRGKKYVEAAKLIDRATLYEATDAVALVKKSAVAKFDETIEAHIRTGCDGRHADQQIRGAVVLPHGTGKTVKVLVFAKGAKAEEAEAAGADFVGGEELIPKIQNDNWFDFDVVVAIPDMMGVVGRLGRVLGPKGLMPNPKAGTVTMAQLKSTFGRLQKINSQTPSYKIDFSDAALKYAIDLKENARELSQIADELSDESTDSITYKRSATSSSPQVIDAEYIGDSCVQDYEPLEVTVSQLACPQTNTGNFLQPNSKPFAAGEYSFDLQVQDLTYQFEFGVNATDTVTDTQQKIARLINQADIGLNAQLLTDGLGNSAISITSDATGIRGISPTIFHIQSQNSSDASDSNTELVSTLGLDRVTQYPANAVYSVNGTTATSVSNEVTIDNNYVLTFFDTTGKAPVTISMNTDTDAIADSIGELIGGYNNLISVTANDANEHFEGNEKLKKDFAGIAKSYNHLLNENGLSVTDNGTIAVDRDAIISAADNGTLGDIFSGLNAFKQAVQKKAEDISLNPMDYVNNKIIAYKNPLRPTNDPYNLSAYTGMIFDGYL